MLFFLEPTVCFFEATLVFRVFLLVFLRLLFFCVRFDTDTKRKANPFEGKPKDLAIRSCRQNDLSGLTKTTGIDIGSQARALELLQSQGAQRWRLGPVDPVDPGGRAEFGECSLRSRL